jgi:hypothetical protein
MDIAHRRGRVTIREVLEELPDPPSYSAVRALVGVLEEKGHLRHLEDGPRYVYTPTQSRERVRVGAGAPGRHVLRRLEGGDGGGAARPRRARADGRRARRARREDRAGAQGGPLRCSLLALWATGALLLLVRLLRGHLLARQRLARSVPVAAALWLEDLAGRPGVELRLSDETDTPLTVGVLRPVILVPRRMLDVPASERRALLAHELAHVARADCLLLLAGAVVRALYWISPLPWWALRSLRARAEDAADDAALRTGIRSSSYAAQLVALARKRLGRACPAPAAGLRDRVGAILDVHRVRSREPRWSVTVLVGAAALIATTVTACEARSAPEPADEAPMHHAAQHR